MINPLAQEYCTVIQPQIIADPTSRFVKFRRPDIYAQIDRSKYTENDFIWIDKLTYGSTKKLWWICPVSPCECHKWETEIRNRMLDKGCPFCSKNGARKTCIHQSFMNNPILASEYDWDLNPGVNPWEISTGSGIELWFRCTKHKTCNQHIWKSSINNRSNERGCPFCTGLGKSKQVCLCDSFMSNPILAAEYAWDLNIGVNPREISHYSRTELWFRCTKHKTCNQHIWKSSINNRSSERGCPWCDHKQTCLCDTFMNNPLLKLLHEEFDKEKNIDIDPYKLSKCTGIYIWWKCIICLFSWQSKLSSRTHGNGCSQCASKRTESKGETRYREYLIELNLEFISQLKLEYIPSRKYDFTFIKDNNTYFTEIDGSQHFKFVEYFHKTYINFVYLQQVDKIKTLIPIILGHSILRISNDDNDHIKMCHNKSIELKTKFDFPLVVFDDITKYEYICDYLNCDVIEEICDFQYHEEIIDSFIMLEINFYDIKTDMLYKKTFDLEFVLTI